MYRQQRLLMSIFCSEFTGNVREQKINWQWITQKCTSSAR